VTNTEFEDRLREEMRHATAGVSVSPGVVRRACRSRQRRIMTGAAATTATAAAAAAAVIVTTGSTGASREGGTYTTADIVRHVESALGTTATAEDIAYLRETDGLVYRWLYNGPRGVSARNEMLPGGGRPGEIDTGSTTTQAGTTMTSVDYHAKTWWRQSSPRTPSQPAPQASGTPSQPSCAAQVRLDVQPDTLPALAADIRQALACGQLTNEGTEQIDGVNAVKLSSVRTVTEPAHDVTRQGKTVSIPATTLTTTTNVWVDPASYLPVRFVSTTTEASASDPGSFLTGSGTWDIEWLPPTGANLALLTVRIPPGFTQVAPPR
jgi:hypothetical protein